MRKVGRVRKGKKRQREIQTGNKMSKGYMKTSKHKNRWQESKRRQYIKKEEKEERRRKMRFKKGKDNADSGKLHLKKTKQVNLKEGKTCIFCHFPSVSYSPFNSISQAFSQTSSC